MRERTFYCPSVNPNFTIASTPIVSETYCKSFCHGEGCKNFNEKEGCLIQPTNPKVLLEEFSKRQMIGDQDAKDFWKKSNSNYVVPFNVGLALYIMNYILQNINGGI